MLLPKPVADYNHWRNPTLEICAPNVTPQLRTHSQQRKEVCSYLRTFDMLRHTAASQIRVPAADGRKLVDLRALLAPLAEIGRSRTQVVVILLRRRFPDRDNPIEVRKWERPEQHCIDRTESGRIGADTERKSNHRDRSETGTPPQQAQSVTDILDQSSHGLFLTRTATPRRDPLWWHGALECNRQTAPPE
jgi:hypothetical protein